MRREIAIVSLNILCYTGSSSAGSVTLSLQAGRICLRAHSAGKNLERGSFYAEDIVDRAVLQ